MYVLNGKDTSIAPGRFHIPGPPEPAHFRAQTPNIRFPKYSCGCPMTDHPLPKLVSIFKHPHLSDYFLGHYTPSNPLKPGAEQTIYSYDQDTDTLTPSLYDPKLAKETERVMREDAGCRLCQLSGDENGILEAIAALQCGNNELVEHDVVQGTFMVVLGLCCSQMKMRKQRQLEKEEQRKSGKRDSGISIVTVVRDCGDDTSDDDDAGVTPEHKTFDWPYIWGEWANAFETFRREKINVHEFLHNLDEVDIVGLTTPDPIESSPRHSPSDSGVELDDVDSYHPDDHRMLDHDALHEKMRFLGCQNDDDDDDNWFVNFVLRLQALEAFRAFKVLVDAGLVVGKKRPSREGMKLFAREAETTTSVRELEDIWKRLDELIEN